MTALRISLLVSMIFLSSLVSAETGIRQETIQFKQGIRHTVVKGRIKGRETVDYLVRVRAGQTMTVVFKSRNSSACFNVLPPGSDEAVFVGSTSGNRFDSVLPTEGLYTIRVYLMRNAARRNESAGYTLTAWLVDAAPARELSFDRTLELQGIRFRVTSENVGAGNLVRIIPFGLERDNTPIERVVTGSITGVEVADINADGSPEIYVYMAPKGDSPLIAYSANRRKSLGEIYLAPLAQDLKVSGGYRGHDEFAVLEGVLGRRFPVFRATDTDGNPTGGIKQLQYRLVSGEAGWFLEIDRPNGPGGLSADAPRYN